MVIGKNNELTSFAVSAWKGILAPLLSGVPGESGSVMSALVVDAVEVRAVAGSSGRF